MPSHSVTTHFCRRICSAPIDFGVDIVVHSTTKYINGHSDVVGGCVVSRTAEQAKKIAWTCNALGLSCTPLMRGWYCEA